MHPLITLTWLLGADVYFSGTLARSATGVPSGTGPLSPAPSRSVRLSAPRDEAPYRISSLAAALLQYDAHQVRLETSDRTQHRTAPNKRHLRTEITGRDGRAAAGCFAANILVFDALGWQHVRSLSQSISSRVTRRLTLAIFGQLQT